MMTCIGCIPDCSCPKTRHDRGLEYLELEVSDGAEEKEKESVLTGMHLLWWPCAEVKYNVLFEIHLRVCTLAGEAR